jgi:uncharacterized protein (UPF0248 family)
LQTKVGRKRGRKGSLEETLSYASYADKPELFQIIYRDKTTVKKASLKEFMESEEFSDIPTTRILRITREGRLVWEKGQKRIEVKETN